MSALEDWWASLWDKIVEKVVGMTDFTADTVFYGEKFPPKKFPSAFVAPIAILGGGGTPTKEDYIARFEIGIVVHEADMKQGVLDVMKLALKIKRTLIADRKLTTNGTSLVDNLEADVLRRWRGLPEFENHWAVVTVNCERLRD